MEDREYLAARAQREDDLARAATCPEASVVHRNLALAYRARLADNKIATSQ